MRDFYYCGFTGRIRKARVNLQIVQWRKTGREEFGSDGWAQGCWNLTAHIPRSHVTHKPLLESIGQIEMWKKAWATFCVTCRLSLGRYNLGCKAHCVLAIILYLFLWEAGTNRGDACQSEMSDSGWWGHWWLGNYSPALAIDFHAGFGQGF